MTRKILLWPFICSLLLTGLAIYWIHVRGLDKFSYDFFGGGDAGHYYNLAKHFQNQHEASQSFCINTSGKNPIYPDPNVFTDMRGEHSRSLGLTRYSSIDGYMSKFIAVSDCDIHFPHAHLYSYLLSMNLSMGTEEIFGFVSLALGLTAFGIVVGRLIGAAYVLPGIACLLLVPEMTALSRKSMTEILAFCFFSMSLIPLLKRSMGYREYFLTYIFLYFACWTRFEFLILLSLFLLLFQSRIKRPELPILIHFIGVGVLLLYYWDANFLHYQSLQNKIFLPVILVSFVACGFPSTYKHIEPFVKKAVNFFFSELHFTKTLLVFL